MAIKTCMDVSTEDLLVEIYSTELAIRCESDDLGDLMHAYIIAGHEILSRIRLYEEKLYQIDIEIKRRSK